MRPEPILKRYPGFPVATAWLIAAPRISLCRFCERGIVWLGLCWSHADLSGECTP